MQTAGSALAGEDFEKAFGVLDRAVHRDALGAATITGSLVLFVYGLNRGVDHGWTSISTLGLFAVAAVQLLAFIRIESRTASQLAPFSAPRNHLHNGVDFLAELFLAFFRYAVQVIVVASLSGAFISSVGFPSRMPVARFEIELPSDDGLVAEPG